MDSIISLSSTQDQPFDPAVAFTMTELETLLTCYRAVVDPLLYYSARHIVDELRLELSEAKGLKPAAAAKRADRLASALVRAVGEWVAERDN